MEALIQITNYSYHGVIIMSLIFTGIGTWISFADPVPRNYNSDNIGGVSDNNKCQYDRKKSEGSGTQTSISGEGAGVSEQGCDSSHQADRTLELEGEYREFHKSM